MLRHLNAIGVISRTFEDHIIIIKSDYNIKIKSFNKPIKYIHISGETGLLGLYT